MNDLDYQMTEKPVSVFIDYFFPDKRRRDVNNYDKPIFDGMSGIVFKDDDQVGDCFDFQNPLTEYVVRKFINRKSPRIEVKAIWWD